MMQNQFQLNKFFQYLGLSLIILILLSGSAIGQTISLSSDLTLIEKEKFAPVPSTNNHPYVFKNQPLSFRTLNPLSISYGTLMYAYENTLLVHFSANCLYHPTCSDFSKQCVTNFGLLKGGLLSVDRVNRCNRIGGADILSHEKDIHTQKCNDPIVKYQ